jgi:N-acetylmuramoyl-L-alanine amidase
MIKHGNKTVDTIWVHCAATRPEWMQDKPTSAKVAEITRWHVQGNKWNAIGYHWIIDRDGAIAKGRDENTVGAHVAGYNTGSIGICLIGGFGSNENDSFDKHFTPEQDHVLRGLIEDIKQRTPIKAVRGHNEVAAKSCPGFSVKRWYEMKPATKKLAESTTMQAGAVQLLSGAGAGAAAVGSLDGRAQLVVLAFIAVSLLATAWIMRERIKKWARETHE